MSRRRKIPQEPAEVTIESLSHEGRGICHIDGKTVFIDNALPGEHVRFKYISVRRKFDQGTAIEILSPSEYRVTPPCEHADICGGCSLQHVQTSFQISHKQAVMLEQLQHIGKVQPAEVLAPLTGPTLGYRHKARLGVKYVLKKERVLVGFREKRSSFIADIEQCEVLHPAVGKLITPLKALVSELSIYNQIPQIEVAIGEQCTVLIFRELQRHSADDLNKLCRFEQEHDVLIYLQADGPESIEPISADKQHTLSYRLDEHDVKIQFSANDFTQVNFAINCAMIGRVMQLLAPAPSDNILDLFCGLGNFTLPLARYAGTVVGVEGATSLVEKARLNAQNNDLHNVSFHAVDLARLNIEEVFMRGRYNKLLLDPPRTGAQEIITQLDLTGVERLVYVSCNPATLARDAGILVNDKGFSLKQAGVMDMFPHTTHVESLAVFEKK